MFANKLFVMLLAVTHSTSLLAEEGTPEHEKESSDSEVISTSQDVVPFQSHFSSFIMVSPAQWYLVKQTQIEGSIIDINGKIDMDFNSPAVIESDKKHSRGSQIIGVFKFANIPVNLGFFRSESKTRSHSSKGQQSSDDRTIYHMAFAPVIQVSFFEFIHLGMQWDLDSTRTVRDQGTYVYGFKRTKPGIAFTWPGWEVGATYYQEVVNETGGFKDVIDSAHSIFHGRYMLFNYTTLGAQIDYANWGSVDENGLYKSKVDLTGFWEVIYKDYKIDYGISLIDSYYSNPERRDSNQIYQRKHHLSLNYALSPKGTLGIEGYYLYGKEETEQYGTVKLSELSLGLRGSMFF